MPWRPKRGKLSTVSVLEGHAPGNGIARMLDLVRRHLDMDVAFVSEFVGPDWVLRYVSTDEAARVRPGHRHPIEETYCKRITDGRLERVICDASAHPEVGALALTAALGIGAYVGVPIVLSDGTLYGTFCSFRHAPDPTLGGRDARFMDLIASLISERLETERAAQEEHLGELARVTAAIQAGEPRIVFQPIVALDTGEIHGLEALARFDLEPSRPPDVWFSEAHRVGRGVELELRAMAMALDHLPRLDHGYLSVNLSPDVLCSPQLEEFLRPVPPARVVLELTEHELIDDIGRAKAAVARLRGAGFRLAIDDIGAGYAGLTKIVHLAPDIIKLDRALVQDVDTDPTRQALVTAGVGFAAALGASLVAEGIETGAEVATLRRLGIVLGQGYHLGRPAPFEHWGERP